MRLGARSLRLVRAQAKARHISTSDLVRALIEAQFAEAPEVSALDLSRGWVGAIRDAKLPAGAKAREALGDWNPDRR